MNRFITFIAAVLVMAGVAYAVEINSLSTTDASNTARFPENMAPSLVNDGARALEGIIARWHKDTNGSTVTTGSLPSLVFAANQVLTGGAYYDGLILTFDISQSVTGATTLNVDGLGAKNMLKHGDQALQAGDLEAGQKVTVVYDGTSFQVISALAANQFHTIWIPAGSMVAQSTSGAAAGSTQLGTGANLIMMVTKDFDGASAEYVQSTIAMPKGWDAGPITPSYFWTAASGSGTVQWYSECVAISNDDPMAATYGTAAGVTDTLILANDNHFIADTVGVTCGGTPAANDLLVIQTYRDAGVDTHAADAKLIGVKWLYKTTASDDR